MVGFQSPLLSFDTRPQKPTTPVLHLSLISSNAENAITINHYNNIAKTLNFFGFFWVVIFYFIPIWFGIKKQSIISAFSIPYNKPGIREKVSNEDTDTEFCIIKTWRCQLKVWKYAFIKTDKELQLRMTNIPIQNCSSLVSDRDLVGFFFLSFCNLK